MIPVKLQKLQDPKGDYINNLSKEGQEFSLIMRYINSSLYKHKDSTECDFVV